MIGTCSSPPDAAFASTPVATGRMPLCRDHGIDAEGSGRTQDRTDIVRIGDLVENDQQAVIGNGVQRRAL